jgi:hypothetical protein
MNGSGIAETTGCAGDEGHFAFKFFRHGSARFREE